MKAPQFTLPFMDGTGYFDLSKERGKLIVITFWVSWCPDCAQDLPKKEALFQSMDQDKVNMITINVPGRERSVRDGEKFAQKFLTQPTLRDNNRDVYDLYQCKGVPTTVLIDQKGDWVESFDDKASFFSIVEAVGKWMENSG
ncbi:TlpA disulfide reductase family protein [Radiobacillus deserti]|uniref:TlpA family protein disulfide reductase n=1 Tax=Radiobacillus deserti TaxID=2594883 RepID=A0A516KHZ1_9BACI|nr:TlpA disulfide reductase family protein [Radiobacillus deserti]QDP41009.1 TlpA family protein disulfide reductase [Radiobacillus deserti]